MKKAAVLSAVALMLTAFTGAMAASRGGNNVIALGGRYHMEHSAFHDLPFGNGDISYALGYEFRERISALQLAVDFAPDLSGDWTNSEGEAVSVDWAVTPQANLLFTDGFLRGGGGVLITYTRDENSEGEWSPVYWQLVLGLHVPPQGRFAIDILAHYVFRNFKTFSDFDFGDIEYSLWISYAF